METADRENAAIGIIEASPTNEGTSDPAGLPLDEAFWVRLSDWLEDHGVPGTTSVGATLLGGGTQNVLVRFSADERQLVLRMVAAHDEHRACRTVEREARTLRALGASAVPHAAFVAADATCAVLGRPFCVTDYVAGVNPAEVVPERVAHDPGVQQHLGRQVGVAAAAIALVRPADLGLANLTRTEGWHQRQAERWLTLLADHAKTGDYEPTIAEGSSQLSKWLVAHTPIGRQIGLVHGDLHLGNFLITDSGEVAAVVDWELTSLGDPLLDLAHLIVLWPRRLDALPGPTAWAGPEVAVAIDAYIRAGIDVAALDWFLVLASHRLAVILEGTHARSLAGHADRTTGERLNAIANELVDRALLLIG